MEKINKYTQKEAFDEASKLKEKIQKGEAKNYNEAEKVVNQEKEIIKKTIGTNSSLDTAFNKIYKFKKDKDGGYERFNRGQTFYNNGIATLLFEVDMYPGAGNAMLYETGLLVQREDGSIFKGPRERWRNSAHTWPSMSGVKNISVKDGKIIADIEYSDGSVETKELGNENASKAYLVVRENESYNSLLDSLDKEIVGNDIIIKGMITKRGNEIVETEDIKQIPENSLVLSDAAALDANQSLENKDVIRIDKILQEKLGSDLSFGAKIRAIKNIIQHPLEITIFEPSCADHPEEESNIKYQDEDEAGYVEYLKKQLSQVFHVAKENISATRNSSLLEEKKRGNLNVVDRHASQTVGEKIYKRSLKLPLYENFSNYKEMEIKVKEQIDKAGKKIIELIKNKVDENKDR